MMDVLDGKRFLDLVRSGAAALNRHRKTVNDLIVIALKKPHGLSAD